MLRLPFRLASLLALVLGAAGALPLRGAATDAKHIDDPAGMLPQARAAAVDTRLAKFERDTGIRILVEFHAHSPSDAEDSAPGAYMRALSTRLGTIETGALAVYFADEDDWRVWIGNNLTARFVGKPGTAEEHTKSGAMHDAKEAWFTEVLARAKNAAKPVESGAGGSDDHVACATEAIADGLIAKLSPVAANR